MPSSKTPYGWMALGGLLCLLGIGLASKLREGSQAQAQTAPPATKVETIPLVPLPEDGPGSAPPATGGVDPKSPVGTSVPVPDRSATPLPPGLAPLVTDSNTPAPLPNPGASVPPGMTDPKSGVPNLTLPASLPDPKGVSALPPQGSPPPAVVSDPIPAPASPQTPEVQKPVVTPAVNVTVPMVDPAVTPARGEKRSEPGEPPLAPAPGPVQMYQVRTAQETLKEIAKRTLGDAERWNEIYNLNPSLKPDVVLTSGAFVRLPADACVPPEEVGEVKPLPLLRPDAGPARPKVLMPLTGTFPCNLDDKRLIALPRAMRDQLGEGDTVLVSPGPDHCLWLTTQDHLERLAKRLEASQAREHEVRSFRRLYFAQTEKMTVSAEGRVLIPERLAQFAGLHQEVVLIGIDDHFELWDVARWRQYTQAKSAAARSAMTDD